MKYVGPIGDWPVSVSKADKPGKVTSVAVAVPVVTSTVSVPEKLVPVRGGVGVAVPETRNVVIVSDAAKAGASSTSATNIGSTSRLKDKRKRFFIGSLHLQKVLAV
jgi:hypothetical protein